MICFKHRSSSITVKDRFFILRSQSSPVRCKKIFAEILLKKIYVNCITISKTKRIPKVSFWDLAIVCRPNICPTVSDITILDIYSMDRNLEYSLLLAIRKLLRLYETRSATLHPATLIRSEGASSI